MDGCPRQNSAIDRRAILKIGASYLKIPARGPDLNPIENFFHQVKKKLAEQAIIENIEKQTFEELSARCKQTLLYFPKDEINTIIESIDKRVNRSSRQKVNGSSTNVL